MDHTNYAIKYTLQYKVVGRLNYKKSFFILEILEMRRRDLLGMAADSSVNNMTSMSMHNTKHITSESNANASGFSM